MLGQCGRGLYWAAQVKGHHSGGFEVNVGLWNCAMPAPLFLQLPEIKFPFSNTSGLSSPRLTPVFASVNE